MNEAYIIGFVISQLAILRYSKLLNFYLCFQTFQKVIIVLFVKQCYQSRSCLVLFVKIYINLLYTNFILVFLYTCINLV